MGIKVDSWNSGWTATEPPEIGHVWMPRDGGTWEAGVRPYLRYRDLGLDAASGGALSVKHIRVVADEEVRSDWHCHDLDFQVFYVLKGSITIENDHNERHVLREGDMAYHPPLYWHKETISLDYEALEIIAPAEVGTISKGSPLPTRVSELDPARRPVYSYNTDDNYVLGAGPRKFFEYRILDTPEATDNRILVHHLRSTEEGPGTGWHYHTMAQWFLVTHGKGAIRVEDGETRELNPGDAMCIGAGPNQRHNVAPISADYAVLEMCVPAEYETTAVPAPKGSAAPPPGAAE
jgi:quercetin dioxygenase-like cupin family protein